VIAASNQTGIGTDWSEEYDFAKTYHEPAFTAVALGSLILGFKKDPDAKSGASQSYVQNYGTGMGAREVGAIWPAYVCSLTNDAADAYRACVCNRAP